jgi:hypothetical protein
MPEAWGGVEGVPGEQSEQQKWARAPDSPVERNSDAYNWWARDVAASLQQAVAEDVAVPKGKGSSEQVAISVLTRRIARQVALQIPKESFAHLVNEARSKMKVVEASCLDQLFDANYDEADGQASEDADTPTGPAPAPAATSQEMADILTRRIPQEMSKWIAKEIYAQLMAAGCESSSTEDDFEDEDELDEEDTWRAAAASSAFDSPTTAPRGLAESAQNQLATASTNNMSHWMAATSSDSSSQSGSVRAPDSPPFSSAAGSTAAPAAAAAAAAPAAAAAAVGPNGELERRYHKADESALRQEAFKKFKLVLVTGNGFRVVKHNHGGGRKTRVLKYDPRKNRICWESSKVLGGEHISCSRIVKVHREACVVYIWHMVGGLHGSVKKMVGFETQREADARILELALLHLKDGGAQQSQQQQQSPPPLPQAAA